MTNQLTDSDELLGREAQMCSQLLGGGLSSIRKYDFAAKGIFYSGMFLTTIGFERLLKLILLLEFKKRCGDYPDNSYLKSKGHKIDTLIDECVAVSEKYEEMFDVEEKAKVLDDELTSKIIAFMTDYAVTSRYYNLDVVTGSSQNTNEPLARWDSTICKIIMQRHPVSKEKIDQFKNIADQIRNNSHVHHVGESGEYIEDVDQLLSRSAHIEHKQGYSVYYIYRLIYFFVKIFIKLDYLQDQQLYLRECVVNLHMAPATCSAIRKRKRWDKI